MDHTEAGSRLAAEHSATNARLELLLSEFASVVAASIDSNADDEHDPEGSTIAFERSQLDALIRQARQQISRVEEAQDRLARGLFGVCAICGSGVDADRLEARPAAISCIACAQSPRRY